MINHSKFECECEVITSIFFPNVLQLLNKKDLETLNCLILGEANTMLKNFTKLDIEWEKDFEDVHTKELDIFDDLMPLNLGKLYLKLHEKDLDGKTYGLITLMASKSKGAIVLL